MFVGSHECTFRIDTNASAMPGVVLHVVRSKQVPRESIKPERGKLSGDSSEPVVNNEAWDIFHDDDARSHLAHDADELLAEVSLVVCASASSGQTP